MSVFILKYSAQHESRPVPMEKESKIEAPSLSKVISKMKISGKEACDLKNYGKLTWVDKQNITHSIEIKEL